jgi:hypothetical protein
MREIGTWLIGDDPTAARAGDLPYGRNPAARLNLSQQPVVRGGESAAHLGARRAAQGRDR